MMFLVESNYSYLERTIMAENLSSDKQRAVDAIDGLDLSMIERQLRTPKKYGGKHNWRGKRIQSAILWYRRFLKLRLLEDALIVPTPDIDEVWHAHILFTKQYQAACNLIFGHYIHHTPSDGSLEKQEQFNTQKALSLDLFQKHFEEQPPEKNAVKKSKKSRVSRGSVSRKLECFCEGGGDNHGCM